jgi:hypothetical protein
MISKPKNLARREIIWGMVIFSFVASAWFIPSLPDVVAIHWSSAGIPDGFAPRAFGAFLLPATALALIALILFLLEHENHRENIRSFAKYLEIFLILLALFFFYLNLIVLTWNMMALPPLSMVLVPPITILLWYGGNLLERSKTANAQVSPADAIKINRHVGFFLKLAALVTTASVLTPDWSVPIIIAVISTVCVYGALFSFHTATRSHHRTLARSNK